MRCLFCGDPVSNSGNGTYCGDCDVYAYQQGPNGRWKVYLPSALVPTSDWVECPACEGSGYNECESPWCSDLDHAGPCGNCHTLGVVRGTLDHPTTSPHPETP